MSGPVYTLYVMRSWFDISVYTAESSAVAASEFTRYALDDSVVNCAVWVGSTQVCHFTRHPDRSISFTIEADSQEECK